ncbi:hypothetical protein LINGRAHAP2_LOCUS19540 [Linum grandiflorum]
MTRIIEKWSKFFSRPPQKIFLVKPPSYVMLH